jgi:acyl-CoA synthetase (AMP-forming)/AMP-acid ligase II
MSSDAKITAEDRPTVYSLLVEAAMRAPEATAITFLPSMESEPIRLTHGAFLARLHRVARLFRELGLARGDVVTLLAPSIPDTVVHSGPPRPSALPIPCYEPRTSPP